MKVLQIKVRRLKLFGCSLKLLANVQCTQARNQDFMWGGANEAKAVPTTEMYFLSSDPFI